MLGYVKGWGRAAAAACVWMYCEAACARGLAESVLSDGVSIRGPMELTAAMFIGFGVFFFGKAAGLKRQKSLALNRSQKLAFGGLGLGMLAMAGEIILSLV